MKANPQPERQQRLLTPRQIFTYLQADRYVVGQERAKRTIAIAAYKPLEALRPAGRRPASA